jgi:DNA repair exonuclease SbcCD ATPase subunit
MRIAQVNIQGFKSFTSDQLIRLKPPGLYLMTGENRAEPTLGANGSGKTSVWDAICWGLYGRTIRGVKGPSVCNWEEADTTKVEVHIDLTREKTPKPVKVIRTQAPNTLNVSHNVEKPDPQPITQEKLDDMLGMDWGQFTSCVMFGQFSQLFMDQTSAEKMNMLSQVLELDRWDEAADKASSSFKEVQKELSTCDTDMAGIQAACQTHEEHLAQLQVEKAAVEDQRKKKHAEYRAGIKQAEKEVAALQAKIDELNDTQAKAGKKLKKAEKVLEETITQRDELRAKVEETNQDISSHAATLKRLRKDYETLKANAGGFCPLCASELKDTDVQAVGRKLNIEAGFLNREMAAFTAELQERTAAFDKADREAGVLTRGTSTLSRTIIDAKQEVRLVENELGILQRTILGLDALLKAPDQELGRLTAREEQIKATIAANQGKIKFLATRRLTLQAKASRFEWWAKTGFKELRLHLIDEAIIELQAYTNNALVALGMEGWRIHFAIEKPTAKGSSFGFHAFVTSPTSKEPKPWESWSGGETQRLRLACAAGYGDMAASRLGVIPTIEVWDEPTQHLSPEGVDQLLWFLKERARSHGKQIWVVEHHSLQHGAFDGLAKVVKDHKGSHLEKLD